MARTAPPRAGAGAGAAGARAPGDGGRTCSRSRARSLSVLRARTCRTLPRRRQGPPPCTRAPARQRPRVSARASAPARAQVARREAPGARGARRNTLGRGESGGVPVSLSPQQRQRRVGDKVAARPAPCRQHAPRGARGCGAGVAGRHQMPRWESVSEVSARRDMVPRIEPGPRSSQLSATCSLETYTVPPPPSPSPPPLNASHAL